ncbi:MAG: ketopantoate reductase family protein [Gemmatimonadales bacterium]|nr:ketopantoate reductase family protein [Gemmatimonadales bacterium]
MNILCYGAGSLGSLYAAQLQEAGHEVTVLTRGRRLADLREHGIRLEDGATGRQSTTHVGVVETLEPSDAYDLVLVVMAKHHLTAVLPHLASNRGTPNILFMCNNAAGPAVMVDALGPERVLLGFPGAAGYPTGDVIRYVIVSRREQPTTVGEVHHPRGITPRLRRIRSTLEEAGFPAAICPNMDAWLKTHAAEIVPTAGALYREEDELSRLAASNHSIDLMIQAIRENYRVLLARRISITPRNHSVFRWLPRALLRGIIRRQLQSELTEIKIGHVKSAATEMKLLADELRGHAGDTRDTPAMDELYAHIVEAADLLSASSHG